MKIGDICYWRASEESTSTFEMKSREATVIATQPNTREIYPEFHSYQCYYIYVYYKYSTLPRGISINIAPKVGIFPQAEGRGKYSLPRVQYYRYSTRKG